MSYASTVLADGAVGYWRLGEPSGTQATDAAGNSNGTYTNLTGVTLGQTGIPGGGGTACKFTAANSGYVAIPDAAAQHVGDAWTIEAWWKVGATGAGPYVFSAQGNSLALSADTSNPPLLFTVKVGVTALVGSTSGVPVDSVFHHIVGTKNGAANKVYIDSVDKSGSVTNSTTVNSTSLTIARTGAGSFLDGTLAEVALYPTALSLATIQNHFAVGSTAPAVGTTQPYDNSTAWTLLG